MSTQGAQWKWLRGSIRGGSVALVGLMVATGCMSSGEFPSHDGGGNGSSSGAGGSSMPTDNPNQTGSGGATGDGGGTAGGGAPLGTGGDGATGGGNGIEIGPLTGPGHVEIVTVSGGAYEMRRDGKPYFVRGIGGQARLETAQLAGVNSTRTWTPDNGQWVLDQGAELGMTVLLGIELSREPDDYKYNPDYLTEKRAEVQSALDSFKDHPALLAWGIGNELNLGADIPEAWSFVNELANTIAEQDPNHPTMTIIAGANQSALGNISVYAQDLDLVGVNSYGALPNVAEEIASSAYQGPYLVTEWGPSGHWESPSTEWGRPIEQTSAAKEETYIARYQDILGDAGKCLGSYVFLWGQKQERTPTWYSMFVEQNETLGLNAESCPTVDAMVKNWTGQWPENRAPLVSAMSVNGQSPSNNLWVATNSPLTVSVTASDYEGDTLSFVWEILWEPNELGNVGGHEPRPDRYGDPVTTASGALSINAPQWAGQYRLFVYVLDGHEHVGTANFPFAVY